MEHRALTIAVAILLAALAACGGRYRASAGSDEDREIVGAALADLRSSAVESPEADRPDGLKLASDPGTTIDIIAVRRYGKAQLRATVDLKKGETTHRKLVVVQKKASGYAVVSVN